METISLTPKNFQPAVELAARILKKGGVIAVPTDTVYGLIADASNEAAVKKIYAVKNRPLEKPLPVFVKNIAMAKKIAAISPRQEKLLDELWPGKITAVIKIKTVLKIFGCGKETVALRIPFYRFLNSLLETYNLPLAQTSANISGSPATTKIDDVLRQFENRAFQPELAINAGDLADSNPSKIIDLTQSETRIIRQ